MGRFFDEHINFKAYSLNGKWKFKADKNNVGEKEHWYDTFESDKTVYVPSVWNSEPEMLTYEGKCWYQKSFFSKGGIIRLHFEAVMTQADIWLDGKKLESHYGGFCEFYRIAHINEGMHTLTVRADNSFDSTSVPQAEVDWYHYGGITRDVSYEILSGICVLGNKFIYDLSSDLKNAAGKFELKLYNAENHTVSTTLSVKLNEQEVFTKNITLSPTETLLFSTPLIEFENIKLWSCENPTLYNVTITTDTYDLCDRIGFRRIEVSDKKILLNGTPIFIKGVNRHEEHPEHGMAFPTSLMMRDINIIKDLGANAIRGSHYPNSRQFLDMLDENGILFYSEIPVWGCGFSEKALGEPKIVDRILSMHKEMIEHYYNHPSIVIFGLHNEILTGTENAYNLTQKCFELVKTSCGNRLVTFASSHPFEDICFKFCDIICINAYYGWYNGELDQWDKFAKEFKNRRAELGFENKPVIISEFGAAAIYGNHTFDCLKWTEEYQSAVMEKCIGLFAANDMFSGCFVWQFCDIRTSKEMGLNRARSFNNKGLLNEYRKPKAAFFTVKNKYTNI